MRIHLCTYYLPAKVTHNQDPSETHDGQQGNQGVVTLQTLTGHALKQIGRDSIWLSVRNIFQKA